MEGKMDGDNRQRQGEKRADIIRRIQDAQRAARVATVRKPKRKRQTWSDTVRDALDERDNLGESPDF